MRLSFYSLGDISDMANEQFFYSTDITENEIILNGGEHYHLSKVLRKHPGDEIWVTNGKGITFQTKIASVNSDKTTLTILNILPKFGEPANRVTLAAGVIKPSHWEILIEKAVELGVYNIVPIISRFTVKPNIKMDRCRKIILSAVKQCGRSRLPHLAAPIQFEEYLRRDFKELTYICDNQDNYPLLSNCEEHQNHVVMVGPEGGFSEDEVTLALKNKFQAVSLGPRRLRAETAAIVAVSKLIF